MHSPRATQAAEILLVDDNRLGLAARRSVLEEMGHRVTVASSGEEALEHIHRAGFDVVITDYQMPGINGVELIRRIRVLRPGIPVILISGYAEALGLTEASTGADAVIAKSAHEVSHLTRTVARLLRRRTARKPASPAANLKARRTSA
jgi:CheY-like chemotaxis protein